MASEKRLSEVLYVTRDLAEISALLYSGLEHKSLIENNGRVYFAFEDYEKVNAQASKFWAEIMEVEPLRFATIMRKVRQLIMHKLGESK